MLLDNLCIADGAIVGTSLKVNDDTRKPLDRAKIRDFMAAVHETRNIMK